MSHSSPSNCVTAHSLRGEVEEEEFKGMVHGKVKFDPFAPCHDVDGGTGDLFKSMQAFRSITEGKNSTYEGH